MANMRIVSRNAVKRATLVASSTAGALVIDNLKSNDKSKSFRATGTSAAIRGAFAVAETISCAHLTHCNLSPSATWRVRLTNEAAAANMFSYTEQLDNAAFTKSGAAIGTVWIIAPDGTSSARAMAEDVSTGPHYVQRSASLTSGVQYTFSTFVKAGGVSRCRFENSTLGASAQFNLLTGTLISGSGTGYNNATITDYGGGWWRITLTFTTTSTGTFALTLYLQNNSNAISYAGSGSTANIYPWGWMLELGLVATSYYPSLQSFTSRASSATYIDSNGLVAGALTNVARMTYQYHSLTAVAPRLLLEAAATNYATYSRDFTNAVWVKAPGGTGSTPVVTTNYAISPEGTLTADRIQFANPSNFTGNNYSLITRNITGVVSNYCASIWMKSNTGLNQEVVFYGATVGRVITVTPEWQRFYLADYSGTTSWAFVFGQRGGVGFTAGGQPVIDISVWEAQAEGGVVPTSNIFTVAAAVNRSADVYTSAAATRPAGYMDWWQSYTLDTGHVLACPAPARELEDWTPAQAASAYSNGGGAHAFSYFAPTSCLAFMIDIIDTANLQGYVEAAAALVVGDYWEPEYNATGASKTAVDSTELYRNAAGGQMADAGSIYGKLPIDLDYMEAADRTKFSNLLMNSRASPILIDLLPGSGDLALRRDSMIYGRRTADSEIALKFAGAYASKIEVEEI
jgi:hypothetical protein